MDQGAFSSEFGVYNQPQPVGAQPQQQTGFIQQQPQTAAPPPQQQTGGAPQTQTQQEKSFDRNAAIGATAQGVGGLSSGAAAARQAEQSERARLAEDRIRRRLQAKELQLALGGAGMQQNQSALDAIMANLKRAAL